MRDQKSRQCDTDESPGEAEGYSKAGSILQAVEPLAPALAGDQYTPDEAYKGENGSDHVVFPFRGLVALFRPRRPYPVQLATSIASSVQSPNQIAARGPSDPTRKSPSRSINSRALRS